MLAGNSLDLHAANQDSIAEKALQRIALQYQLENEATGYSREEWQRWRAEHGEPNLESMHL
jgi:hypothetical protein